MGRHDRMAGHWAEDRIYEVASWGVVSGYPDGSFQPDGLVSRAAFVKMIVQAAGIETCTAEQPTFRDTGDHWVFTQGYMEAAVKAGFVKVSEYGAQFQPDLPITREEMAVMAVREADEGVPPRPEGRRAQRTRRRRRKPPSIDPELQKPALDTGRMRETRSYSIGATGLDEPEDKRFRETAISVSVWAEAGSEKYEDHLN